MLRISQIIEITQQSCPNAIDLATGRPIISSPPPEIGEVVLMRNSCLVCGAPVWWARPVGQRGRHRRFCSKECWWLRHAQHQRANRWREGRAGTMDLFDQPTGERHDETNEADA